MYGALTYVAYTSLYRDVLPSVCRFNHVLYFSEVVVVVLGRVLTALTRRI